MHADELREAAQRACFEGLTKHHGDHPKLIPSEKLREALMGLRAALTEKTEENRHEH